MEGDIAQMTNEATVRHELRNMLRYHYGLWPDHWPDIPGTKRPGRPDLIVMNPRGPGFYIEVKTLYYKRNKSFGFDRIEQSQRNWLSTWEEQRHGGSWLAIGVIGAPDKRSTFVIPWTYWQALEDLVKEHQHSLPYVAGKGFSKPMQEDRLDFRLINDFKLDRVPPSERKHLDSGWRFKEEEPWLRNYQSR